jgi:hypothetical protein
MRYVVRAQQDSELIAFAFSTAADAIAKAWSLMGSGATGLYIYDVNTYEAYFPDEFAGLFKMTAASHRMADRAIGPTPPAPLRPRPDHP